MEIDISPDLGEEIISKLKELNEKLNKILREKNGKEKLYNSSKA